MYKHKNAPKQNVQVEMHQKLKIEVHLVVLNSLQS